MLNNNEKKITPGGELLDIVRRVLAGSNDINPLHEPLFEGNEWAYIKDCLDTGWVSSVGSYVDQFEDALAEVCDVRHAILTMNGTAALHAAMSVLGIQRDEEILVPSLTFVATTNAISYMGAVPHFVDSSLPDLSVDTNKLRQYLGHVAQKRSDGLYNIQTGRKIAALLPVHLYGHAAKLDAIQELADEFHLPLLYDGAEALGCSFDGRSVFGAGEMTTLSFNGNKIITTGGGGAILTNSDSLAQKAKHITTTAKVPHRWRLDHDAIGFNYRMPNINAALGLAQLEQLPNHLADKRKLAQAYEKAFAECSFATFLSEPENTISSYWLCTILMHQASERGSALEMLNDAGYLCRPAWTPMHQLPMYENCPRMDLTGTEDLAARIINLPSSVTLGRALS